MRTHIVAVHSSIYPWTCHVSGCGLQFKTKGSYMRHQRRHTGERPFKCDSCGRSFRESGALYRHRQSKISCVNKSDVNFPRYGLTQPIGNKSENDIDNSDIEEQLQPPEKKPLAIHHVKNNTHPLIPCDDVIHIEQVEAASNISEVIIDDGDVPTPDCSFPDNISLSNQMTHEFFSVPFEDSKTAATFASKRFDSENVPSCQESVSNLTYDQKPNINHTSQKEVTQHDKKLNLLSVNERHQISHDFENSINDNIDSPMPVEESKAAVMSQIMKAKNNIVNKMMKQEHSNNNKLQDRQMSKDTKMHIRKTVQCKREPVSSSDLQVISSSAVKPSNSCQLKSEINEVKNNKNEPEEELPNIIRSSFTCSVCAKSFNKKFLLERHLKNHLREFNLSCNVCNKSFNNDQALTRHLTSHSNVRQYECHLCSKSFKLLSAAKTHLNSHNHDKNYTCDQCGKCFKSVSSRNAHLKIHSGEKTHVCETCNKSFITKGSLNRHQRQHTGETPFVCPYCNYGFKEHKNLKRHLLYKMPCAQHAKIETKSSNIKLLLGEPNTNNIQNKSSPRTFFNDLRQLMEEDSTFDETETLPGSQSPSVCSILDEAPSSILSSHISYAESLDSRVSLDDDENIEDNLLSNAIASLTQDSDKSTYHNMGQFLHFFINTFASEHFLLEER